MIGHILVAIDGSEHSRRAARFAHDLAQQTRARITLLYVLEPPRVLPIAFMESAAFTSPHTDPKDMENVQRLLEQVAADLPKAQVEKQVELGPPADTIVAVSQRLAVDLIVVGSRGLSLGGKWLLGSVSDRVVQHAGRPVTVVH
ncbi:MAG: universal stress protein [Hyalangium sp.]|uniref:universal stress protein n=1 Tax=Hyalangium sp. TaxID=2028555 RepID=UPI003899AE5D